MNCFPKTKKYRCLCGQMFDEPMELSAHKKKCNVTVMESFHQLDIYIYTLIHQTNKLKRNIMSL